MRHLIALFSKLSEAKISLEIEGLFGNGEYSFCFVLISNFFIGSRWDFLTRWNFSVITLGFRRFLNDACDPAFDSRGVGRIYGS